MEQKHAKNAEGSKPEASITKPKPKNNSWDQKQSCYAMHWYAPLLTERSCSKSRWPPTKPWREHSGVAQCLARCAHNPRARGPKPRSTIWPAEKMLRAAHTLRIRKTQLGDLWRRGGKNTGPHPACPRAMAHNDAVRAPYVDAATRKIGDGSDGGPRNQKRQGRLHWICKYDARSSACPYAC